MKSRDDFDNGERKYNRFSASVLPVHETHPPTYHDLVQKSMSRAPVGSHSTKPSRRKNAVANTTEPKKNDSCNKQACTRRVDEFARETTIHGIDQILRSDQPWINRVVWSVAFLTAAVACVHLIAVSFTRYLSFEVKTTTSMVTEGSIDFPAVTICNENMLKKSLVGGSPEIIAAFTAIIVSNIAEYEPKLKQALRTCFTNSSSAYTNMLNSRGYQYLKEIGINQAMKVFSLDSDKSVISCWWKDKARDCKRQFLNHITDFGWCFTLNPSRKLLSSFELGFTIHDTGYGVSYDYEPLILRSTGPDNGFKMLLNVHQDEYCVTRTDSAGFKVLIHAPSVQPLFFLEKPLSIPPGFETNVAIKYTKQMRDTSWLDRCVESLPLFLYPKSKIYFKEACYLQCITEYVFERCNCTPLYGPSKSNYIMATRMKRDYVKVCWDRLEAVCMKRQERSFLDEGLHENCPKCLDPCRSTHYDIQVSTAYFPAENFNYLYEEMLNRSEKEQKQNTAYLRQNLALVNFYVESMQVNIITETQGFTADQLVSEIGGQVGFLLGMSLLSLFEFVQCLMPRVKRGRRKTAVKIADKQMNIHTLHNGGTDTGFSAAF